MFWFWLTGRFSPTPRAKTRGKALVNLDRHSGAFGSFVCVWWSRQSAQIPHEFMSGIATWRCFAWIETRLFSEAVESLEAERVESKAFTNQFATRNKCHASSNKCLTSSNKKLLGTSASLTKTRTSVLGESGHGDAEITSCGRHGTSASCWASSVVAHLPLM